LLEETAMELAVADPLYRQSRRDAREDGRLCGDEPETGSQQLNYAGIQYPNIHQKHQFIKRYKH
jgi:hypothetical protein